MYAYPLKDNQFVLITKKEKPTELLKLLVDYGFFEPVYYTLEEVLIDLVSSMLIDLQESNVNNITDDQIQNYIFNYYFEDKYDINTEIDELFKHLCKNLSEYKGIKIDCKKLSLNKDVLNKEGVYDIREVIVWRVK